MVQAKQDHTRGIYERAPLASAMDETAQCESVSEHAHICGTTRASMSESQRRPTVPFGPGAPVKEQASVLVLCTVFV